MLSCFLTHNRSLQAERILMGPTWLPPTRIHPRGPKRPPERGFTRKGMKWQHRNEIRGIGLADMGLRAWNVGIWDGGLGLGLGLGFGHAIGIWGWGMGLGLGLGSGLGNRMDSTRLHLARIHPQRPKRPR